VAKRDAPGLRALNALHMTYTGEFANRITYRIACKAPSALSMA